jgi:DNA-binding winged helix-turn-helix (wHTH) protein
MTEIGPEHPVEYRREIAASLFWHLRSGDSCAVIGPASMGKSRLVRFLLRPDTQAHYLSEAATRSLFALADCNRMAELSAWGLYELILTALVEAAGSHPDALPLRDELLELRRDALLDRNALLAQRQTELALRMLITETGLNVNLFLDEFDACYKLLPGPTLANLRALRDEYKYQLRYVLFMREHPARLRPGLEIEGFYELLGRAVLGLGPYSEEDAGRMVDQLVERRGLALSEEQRRLALEQSGRYPGLLSAVVDAAAAGPLDADPHALLRAGPAVAEECRKIWDGLAEDERRGLSRMALGVGAPYGVEESLALKGLITPEPGHRTFVSPIFRAYAEEHGDVAPETLWLDEATCVVWIGDRQVSNLTPLEFTLLRYLYRREGEVCLTAEILDALHPNEPGDTDPKSAANRLQALVKRLRQKVEPIPQQPQYILSSRGMGYQLSGKGKQGRADS